MSPEPVRSGVPPAVDAVVAWTWRLLVLAAGLYVLGLVVGRLSFVVGASAAGLLLTALLEPLVALLARRRVPRPLAAGLVFLAFVALVVLGLRALGASLLRQLEGLVGSLGSGLDDLEQRVVDSPLPVTTDDLRELVTRLGDGLSSGEAASSALSVAGTATDLFTGAVLALFVLLVLLLDGARVWGWLVGRLPRGGRERADSAGHAAWATTVGYLRGLGLVAFVDASLIGLALVLLDVPFVLPLAALTFVAAFVPYVGASVAGALAAVVALVDDGAAKALLVLAAVLLVQTLDGYVLEPLVVGKAVSLHPLAVVLAIAVGGVLGGVGGAVVAVPLTAGLNAFLGDLGRTAPR